MSDEGDYYDQQQDTKSRFPDPAPRKPFVQTLLFQQELQVKCKELDYPTWNKQDCQILSVDNGPELPADVFFTWIPKRRNIVTNGQDNQPMRVGVQLSQQPDSILAERTESLSGVEQHIVELSGKAVGAPARTQMMCTVYVALPTLHKRNELIRVLSVPTLNISAELDGNQSVGDRSSQRESLYDPERRCAPSAPPPCRRPLRNRCARRGGASTG